MAQVQVPNNAQRLNDDETNTQPLKGRGVPLPGGHFNFAAETAMPPAIPTACHDVAKRQLQTMPPHNLWVPPS